ncbi:MAG: asparagine synthase-related protein, partial [Myxococcota bacterium]
YYAQTGDGLLLASEAKALFAAGVPARWDPVAFYDNLCGMVPLPAESTLFAGVRQLGPGQLLVATAGDVRTERYWNLDFPAESLSDSPRTELTAEELEHLSHVLSESIRLRLRADVPVGVYLSGGVDSSALLGFAARHVSTPLRVFSIGFESATLDEEPAAARTAHSVGADYYPLRVTGDLMADSFGDAVFHSEYPHHNAHGVAKFLLSRHTHRHDTKTVLAGEGADELFLGYPWLILDLLQHDVRLDDASSYVTRLGPEAASMVHAARAISLYAAGHPWMTRIKAALGFLPSLMALNAAYYLRPEARAMMRRDWRDRLPDSHFAGRLLDSLDIPGQMHGRARARQAAYVQWRTTFPSYNLNVLGDRMEMAHSVEGRVPYLDHHVVTAVNRLPAAALFRGTTDKYPLREIARPVIPPEVYTRPKHMFMAPDLDPQSKFGQLVHDTIHGTTLKNHPLYDRDAVLTAVDKLGSIPLIRSRILCTVVSACILQERLALSGP